MNSIISIFESESITAKTKAKVIIKLGTAINYKYGANITEELIVELLIDLGQEEMILNNYHLKKYYNKIL